MATPLAARAGRVVFPIASASWLLSSRVAFPEWTVGMARLSFGVYLVHPLIAKPLEMMAANLAFVGAYPWTTTALAVLVIPASAAVVLLLMETPLRRACS